MAMSNGTGGGSDDAPDLLEQFWAHILSEDPTSVQAAWATLTGDEKTAVYRHLQRMGSEDGWHPSQRDAARAALQAIGPFTPAAEE
jgi:hypothetical protein